MSEHGKLLRKAREKKGYTQTDVGRRLGFNPQFYNRVEQGEVKLPVRYIKKVCSMLDLSVEALHKAYLIDYTSKLKLG